MRKFLALTLAVLTLAGCADPESSIVQNANPAKEESPVDPSSDKTPNPGPGKPDWELTASPSTAESCKVEDGLPDNVLALGRGSYYDGGKARGPVGFPWVSSYFLPPEGQLKFLMVLVSFEDTEKFTEQPSDYWDPQANKLSDWFDYWSRGKMSIETDTHESWIDLPYPSTEAPRSDARLANDIVERFEQGINPNDYDSLIIQWAPGIETGTRSRFRLSLNSIDQSSSDGDNSRFNYTPMIWSTHLEFYQNDYEVRRDNIWGSLVHEILHEMNFNLHGPGNGWGTGVGQSYRANQSGGVSYVLTAWEQFLVGWMPESEVHCIELADLEEEQSVILSPLEVAGGDRKALIVPISNSDVLVVESRRPVGYSESWDSENSGLLAYTVNPQEEAQKDHIDEDCGNDPTYTKWAYYLFPDQEREDASAWCGAMGGVFTPAIFNQGETLTHNGVHLELVYSDANQDFIRVTKASGDYVPPAGFPDLGPPAPNGGWWNQCEGGDCPLELPNPAENFGFMKANMAEDAPDLDGCDDLSQRFGFRNGIAASREFRDKAGAAVATLISTQWYAKNRGLDKNLDGVICSCQAPELEPNSPGNDNQVGDCITLQDDAASIAPDVQSSSGSSGQSGSSSSSSSRPLSECGENWWRECYQGSVPLPNVAENSGHGKPVDNPERIGPPNCDGLAASGITGGIAGSFALRGAASAPSAIVSTQWYAKLYVLDKNRDGVLCSSEAPESSKPTSTPTQVIPPAGPVGLNLAQYSQLSTVTRYPRQNLTCSCCCG